MAMTEFDSEGFDDLERLLQDFAKKTEDPMQFIEPVAKEFVKDVKKLSSPRSRLSGAGYTHLLDTISYKKKKDEIETGWGKYYGPMLEHGTSKMSAQPHLKRTFIQNREKYYKKIEENFYK